MKRTIAKIVSIVMALSLLTAVFVVPTSAAKAGSKLDVSFKLQKVIGEVDCQDLKSEDNNIYKLIVHVNSNDSLGSLKIGVIYDKAQIMPLYLDPVDGIYYDYESEGGALKFETLNSFADARAFNTDGSVGTKPAEKKYYGAGTPGLGISYTVMDYTDDDLARAEAFKQAGLSPEDTTKDYLTVQANLFVKSAKPVKGFYGSEDLFAIYVRVQDGVDLSDINFIATNMGGALCTAPTYVSELNPAGAFTTDSSIYPRDNFETYTAAGTEIDYSIAVPTYWKDQIRFQKNGTAYAGKFDYRVLAAIPADNFNKVFGSEDNAKTMIKDIGFVFAEKAKVTTFDMGEAQRLVAGLGTDVNYVKKQVNFLQQPSANNGNNYVFSCIVKDNATELAQNSQEFFAYAYIVYNDAEGTEQYAFFDAMHESTSNAMFKKNFDNEFKGSEACPF